MYGKAVLDTAKTAEAFQVCEYGRHPDKKQLRELFPFLPEYV